ncbi:hypothetical protein FNB79_07625 [Formosa sediminum]|uniref:Uncharacterized protein n=1 Tax=Formosa sediminum TaxID=2594004 RepID=A0A516GQQ6_9FLAO|nr:hypothetical protein [Formosa sediminum]QDO93855.1 hypothetical protein FNB79_07625 [Formosa sediminum]
MSNYQQKQSWSLQDNKRSEAEREAFKPTGKTSRKLSKLYVIVAVLITYLTSLTLTVGSKKTLETCLTSEFCFNSKDNVFLYALYVFSTIAIIGGVIFVAYKFGKRFGNAIKQ